MIFTFDGDAAGQRAALRAFGMEEKFATQTYVTVQPDGLDPCDLRLAHGDAAVRDLIARRVPLFEFAIKGVLGHHDLNTTEGQLAALDEAAPIVAGSRTRRCATRYAVNLDRWLGLMDERFVLARVRRARGRDRAAAPRDRAGRAGQPAEPERRSRPVRRNGAAGGRRAAGAAGQPTTCSDPVVQVEREVLKLAVQRPALCGPEFDALGAGRVHRAGARAVFMLIAACGGTAASGGSPRQWAARLREEAPNERAAGVRDRAGRRAAADRRASRTPSTPTVVLARVGELAVSREITAVKARLQRMNPVEEQAGYNRMFGDLVGAGETPEGPARPGRRRLKPGSRAIIHRGP